MKALLARSALQAFLLSTMILTLTSSSLSRQIDSVRDASSFQDLLDNLYKTQDSIARTRIVEEYLHHIRHTGGPAVGDSTVHFLYHGPARRVSVAGDINRWNADADTMMRVAGTHFFHLSVSMHPAARFEYKLVVDSVWMLDPLNRQQVTGGFGPNSEVTMPLYKPPVESEYRADIPHGRIDTLRIHSKLLRRTYTVFTYLPPDYSGSSRKQYPSIYVTDGGEYLSLAGMHNVLDNMIADKRIRPVVAVFIDARTDIHKAETSTRMQDYAMRDSFVTFLTHELRPLRLRKYRLLRQPENTAIMGASLGGLIATYSAFKRPDVFGLCAAQSPSYWWMKDSMIALVQNSRRKNINFYIGTGTIHDAQEKALKMRDIMLKKGYTVHYEEFPESHNWANWRARIKNILEYFWRRQ
ncbi:MAG: hypothetical protein KF749_17335 [Bacteroidetes bacterium]|nr:hypothetical protein [Bacteroidota bacterium]MCW5896035.1 hypothetical protein [Bacteroidota bacterium]